jgi:CxxH/CxxC protein (TIGR04129 family)
MTERMLSFMYVVCKDHVELAIDKFVDEYEDAPDVVDLKETEFSDWDPPVKCVECEEAAQYLVV